MLFVPAPHPPEFRRRALELARQGERPIGAVAKQLRISESCLRNWLGQAEPDEGGGDRVVDGGAERTRSAAPG